jgi:hypothetical protein
MSNKEENLVKLIKLVVEISNLPNHDWFKEKLLSHLSSSTILETSDSSKSIKKKIDLIHKYLSIDVFKIIDYSFFGEPSREQLFRDCIEMGRYEKGTPNHKIDFGEFCRYAHLQAEEMINYFMIKISNSDIIRVVEFIKEKVQNYNPPKLPKEIHHINYSTKLSAFKTISNLNKKSNDYLWFINDVRNELSHRNSLSSINEDKDLVLFKENGFESGRLDFNKMSKIEKDIYNRGNYVIRKRKMEFDVIYGALEDLKIQITDVLNANSEMPITNSTIGDSNPVLKELKDKFNEI